MTYICLQASLLAGVFFSDSKSLLAGPCLNSADWWPFSANGEVGREMNWGAGKLDYSPARLKRPLSRAQSLQPTSDLGGRFKSYISRTLASSGGILFGAKTTGRMCELNSMRNPALVW